MSTLRADECEVGMKVLLTDPDPDYDIGSSNPKVGTKWECEGRIEEFGPGSISVRWDNGYSNGYKDHELSPTTGGICIDIWKEIG